MAFDKNEYDLINDDELGDIIPLGDLTPLEDGNIGDLAPIEDDGGLQMIDDDLGELSPVAAQSEPDKDIGALSNIARGAGERAADLAGNVAGFAATAGANLEKDYGIGGFVWGQGDIIPTYKDAEEYKTWQQDKDPETSNILRVAQNYMNDADLGYQARNTWENVKDADGVWNTAKEVAGYAFETGLVSIPDMAAMVANMPLYLQSRTEEIAQERAHNSGRSAPSPEDVAFGATASMAVTALDRFGLDKMLAPFKGASGSALKKIGTATATEFVTEGIQEGIEYTAETAYTNKPFETGEMVDRMAAGAVAGGPFGGGIAATGVVTNEIKQRIKNKPNKDALDNIAEKVVDDISVAEQEVGQLGLPAPTIVVTPEGVAATEASMQAAEEMGLRGEGFTMADQLGEPGITPEGTIDFEAPDMEGIGEPVRGIRGTGQFQDWQGGIPFEEDLSVEDKGTLAGLRETMNIVTKKGDVAGQEKSQSEIDAFLKDKFTELQLQDPDKYQPIRGKDRSVKYTPKDLAMDLSKEPAVFPEEALPATELPSIPNEEYNAQAIQKTIKKLKSEKRESDKGAPKNVLHDIASRGQIDWDMAVAEGFEPADMIAANKKGMPFGKPLFKKGSGNGFDSVAEKFSELGVAGFGVGETYQDTAYSADDAINLVGEMISGKREPVYMPGSETAELERQQKGEALDNTIYVYENLLEEVGQYESILENEGQEAADEFYYQQRAMEGYEQEVGGEVWVEGDEVTVDTNFDQSGETLANLLDQATAADPEFAAQEFDRLVDASDAQIARAMHNIIKGDKDAETKAEAEQRGPERGDIEAPKTEAERQEVGEKPSFLQPHEYKTGQYEAKAAEYKLSEAQKEAFKPEDERDDVTGMYPSKDRVPTMNRARDYVDANKTEGSYGDIDVRNLGGLNAAFTHTGANRHFKAFADIVAKHADDQASVKFRHGGDEMSVVAPNTPVARLIEQLSAAQAEINEYVKDNDLQDLPHAKHEGKSEAVKEMAKGTGIYFGVSMLDTDVTNSEIIQAAEEQTEAQKPKELVALETEEEADGDEQKIEAARAERDEPGTGAERAEQPDQKDKGPRAGEKTEAEQDLEAAVDELGDLLPGAKSATEISEAAANAEGHTASQAQIDAGPNGNYKKGHLYDMQGFNLAIENEAGTKRNKMTPAAWPVLAHSYGDIKPGKDYDAISADGDQLDFFIKKDVDITADNPIYVISQNNKDGSFDETKTMFGFDSAEDAKKGYLDSYSDDFTGFGDITEATPEQYKDWLVNGDTKKAYPFTPKLELAGQTEAEIQADEQAEVEAKKKEVELEKKAEADEGVDEFALTGSEREADIAAAAGQEDLLVAPAEEKPVSAKAEPWQMTGKEWAKERGKVRPEIVQSKFTKASMSQAVARTERLEELLYGVTDEASNKMKLAIAGEIKLSSEELEAVDDRLNTKVTHRDVIEKALAEGKDVPTNVLSGYPDMVIAPAEKIEDVVEPVEEKPDDTKATEILDAANVRGKDRLDAMSKFRSGEYSLDDLTAAYPAEEEVVTGEDLIEAPVDAEMETAEDIAPDPIEEADEIEKAAKDKTVYSKSKGLKGNSGLGDASIKPQKIIKKELKDILDAEGFEAVSVTGGNVNELNSIAKSFGKTIVFYRDMEAVGREIEELGEQPERDTEVAEEAGENIPGSDYITNGFVNSGQTGDIFLNVDGSNHLLYVLGHELGHSLRNEDPALWVEMANELQPLIKNWSHYKEGMAEKFDSDLQNAEELFGDVIGQNLLDSNFWEDMAKAAPKLFKKLAKKAIDLLNKALKIIIGKDANVYVSDMEQARAVIAKTLSKYADKISKKAYSRMAKDIDADYINKRSADAVVDQTKTEAFKDWFGDSKVVDENGEPLVVYHGTGADIESFDRTGEFEVGDYGSGYYFTQDKYLASGYAIKRGDGANVVPVFVSIRNPYIINIDTNLRQAEQKHRPFDDQKDAEKFTASLKEKGHDGVFVIERDIDEETGEILSEFFEEIIAFEPTQIKSVIGNIGAFDPSDPRILFSKSSFTPNKPEAIKGITEAQAEEALKIFLKEMGKPSGVKVFIAPTKKSAMTDEAYSKFKKDQVRGFYKSGTEEIGGGRIVLILEDIESVEKAVNVLRHEWVAHHGLNTFNPADKKKIINRIRSSKGEMSLKAAWAHVEGDYPNASPEIQAEELLAYMAENKATRLSKLWNDLVLMIQNALKKMGLIGKGKITKAEVVRFVEDLASRVGAGAAQQTYEGDVAYSKADTKERSVQLTPTEAEYFSAIFDNDADLIELREAAPSARIDDNNVFYINKGDISGLTEYIDQTVIRREVGQKLPPRFASDKFMKNLEAQDFDMEDVDIMYSKRTPKDVVSAIDEKSKGSAETVKKFFTRYFTKEGLLPKAGFEAKILKDSEKNVGESDLSVMTHDFEKDMAEAYGVKYNKISDADLNDVNSYLAGNKGVALPKGLHGKLDHLRAYLDRLSGGMQVAMTDMLTIEAGNLSDKDADGFGMFLATDGKQGYLPKSMQKNWNTYQKIEENKGSYLTRSYQAFDDKNWINKVKMNAPLMKRARDFVAAERPELTPDEVIGAVNVILEKAFTAGNFMSFMGSSSKLGGKDTSIITKRKDVPDVIRELLGEYKDPKVNFVRSATKMQWFVANHNFLMSLRNEGLGEFLFEKPTGDYAVEIASKGSETMNPLNGLFTTRDIDTALIDASGSENTGDFMRELIKYNSMIKYGKTILSVTTQFRNFQSAMMFSVMNGHFDWSHMRTAGAVAWSDMFTKDKVYRDYINNLVGLGVIHNNPYAGEIRDALEDFMSLDTETKGLMQNPKKVLNFMQKTYQLGDDFWKIIGFENEKQLQIEAGKTPVEAVKIAAYRIRNGYPTYSMVPKGIKFVRKAPLVGTFVSFPYEIVRTSYNQIGFIKEDRKAGNTKMANRRVLGMAISSSAAVGLSVISMMIMGIDGDDDEAVKKFLPPWSRNSQLIYTGYDENGMPTYYDISYIDPYTYLKKPISALLSGNNEGFGEKISDAMTEILEPFIGVDIGAGALIQLYSNEKETGGKIWNEQDSDWGKTKAILGHIRKAVQPGTMSSIERMILAMQDERSRGGKQYKVSDETWALLGHRSSTLNIPQAMVYKSYQFMDAKAEASMLLSYISGSASKISPEEIESATEKMLIARKRIYGHMIKIVKAAQKLKVSEDDISGIMEASGISTDDVDYILDGETAPWDMPFSYGEKGLDRALITAHDEERRAEINEEYDRRLNVIDDTLDEWEKDDTK